MLLKRFTGRILAVALFTLISSFSTSATASDVIVKVEEDWELTIREPDGEGTPQVINVISPRADLSKEHAVFEINHVTQPSFGNGGMQLQSWYGSLLFKHRNSPKINPLSHNNEVVKYTMCLEVSDHSLITEVRNGTSQTWGTFGGQGYLRTAAPTYLENLSGYRSTVSTENTGVSVAAHRVQKLVLKEVRYYSVEGLLKTDSTPKVVHEYKSLVKYEE